MCAHTHTHTYTNKLLIHWKIISHDHTHTHTHKLLIHWLIISLSLTHTQAHTHTHTQRHTHTHTQTHTQNSPTHPHCAVAQTFYLAMRSNRKKRQKVHFLWMKSQNLYWPNWLASEEKKKRRSIRQIRMQTFIMSNWMQSTGVHWQSNESGNKWKKDFLLTHDAPNIYAEWCYK